MDNTREERHFRQAEPDAFDRAYGQAQGFAHVKPETITAAKDFGIGGVRSFIVETFRVPDAGDAVFITIAGPEGLQRVYLPPQVTKVITRQHEKLEQREMLARAAALSAERSRMARERAAADKAAGKVPGFMRGKK